MSVCVCVCVCVINLSERISWTYLRGTDQQSCAVSINLGTSATFLHLLF